MSAALIEPEIVALNVWKRGHGADSLALDLRVTMGGILTAFVSPGFAPQWNEIEVEGVYSNPAGRTVTTADPAEFIRGIEAMLVNSSYYYAQVVTR